MTAVTAGRPGRRCPEPQKTAVLLRTAVRSSRGVGRLLLISLWLPPALLVVFGLCMMLSISFSLTDGPGRYALLRDQAMAVGLGLVLLLVTSRIRHQLWRKLSLLAFFVVFLSLLAVHIPGVGLTKNGARSWVGLGDLTYQPSEFAKLAVILLGAHLLTSPRVAKARFSSYIWPFGVLGLGVCGLVLLEGDLGTAVIIAGLVLGLLWLGGMRLTHWLLVAGAGLAGFIVAVVTSEERMSRVFGFLHPFADPYGSTFQLVQSLVALGRGGLLGVGPGQSVQKFQYLPQAHTDMIYAIIGEEFGLVGTALIVLLFAVFAVGCWQLARRCREPMGRLIVAGCGMLVVSQAIINIGGVIGALPLTGVPLPFVSYGSNSLLVMMTAVGLVMAVARTTPQGAVSSRLPRYENVTSLDRWRRHSGPRGARASSR